MAERRRGLAAAAQFLTRVPIRTAQPPDSRHMVAWFPVVGVLIGAAVGGIAAGLGEIVPTGPAAALAVLAGVLITGAFHEDGLADVADAVAGGSTVEQRQAILRDPRHGTYGVAALAGSIVLRVTVVAALAPAAAFAGLVTAHALARGAAVVVLGSAPHAARAGDGGLGLGTSVATSASRRDVAIAAVVALGAGAIASGWWVGPAALGAAAVATPLVVVAGRALGAISGDVLGAVEQVAECAVLVVIASLSLHHVLWWAG